jgi:hypothetical protein
MTSSRRPTRIALLCATAWLAGCAGSSEGPPLVCTGSFAFIPLAVLNPNNTPATSVIELDTVLSSDVGFPVPQDSSLLHTGTYDIFDDNYLGKIRHSGDSVRVTGIQTPKRFSVTFFIDTPDGCHVHKVSGPDTVQLQ